MSYRFMRVIVFFDLPMESSLQKREYTKFRKYLIRNGFFMMQKSVYTKLALNSTASMAMMENVKKNKPGEGIVQMLTVTEKQFSKMEFVVGDYKSNVLSSTDRTVIL